MEQEDRADQWYSGRKTVLKPLLEITSEGFEVQNSILCSRASQFATDCVQAGRNRGVDLATVTSHCAPLLVNVEVCKSKIYCPVETSAFMHTCTTKRNTASVNTQCQKSIAALKQCAAASNLSEWWMSPMVRIADRKEQDDLSLLHLRSQRTL
jgi:hypothetical protein